MVAWQSELLGCDFVQLAVKTAPLNFIPLYKSNLMDKTSKYLPLDNINFICRMWNCSISQTNCNKYLKLLNMAGLSSLYCLTDFEHKILMKGKIHSVFICLNDWLPTYLPTYLSTYLPACLPTCQPIYRADCLTEWKNKWLSPWNRIFEKLVFLQLFKQYSAFMESE